MGHDVITATCGQRWESRCIDYEGDVAISSPLYGEGFVTVHDVLEDMYTVSVSMADTLALKADIANPTFTGTVSGITQTMIGLPSVDDTADIDKPVSDATQTALNLKVDAQVGYGLVPDADIALLATFQNYTHPSYSPIPINTAAAEVIDTLTVDALGSVTAITLRTLTLEDLGFSEGSVYTHPVTHDPSIILQDSLNRFVTDVQITAWDKAIADILLLEGGGLTVEWGEIGGTLTAQTDLQAALDAKQNLPTATYTFAEIDANGNLHITGDIIVDGEITAHQL